MGQYRDCLFHFHYTIRISVDDVMAMFVSVYPRSVICYELLTEYESDVD